MLQRQPPTSLPVWERPVGLRGQIKRWTTPPRRLVFTRPGKFFMLLTLGVGLGALNTGQNLLFLLLGMLLSAIIASGLLSEAVIQRLRIRRAPPRRLWAGSPAPGTFTVENPRRTPTVNLEICERGALCIEGPLMGQEIGPKNHAFWKFWLEDNFDDDSQHIAIGRTLVLEPGQSQTLEARYMLPTRGRWRLIGLRKATRFPFGLFHKVADREDALDILVFPRPQPASRWVHEVASRFGDVARQKPGLGEDFFGLRELRHGDDPRQVHWRATARRGKPVVREAEEQAQRAILVYLVNATGHDGPPTPAERARFERGLGRAVTLLNTLAEQGAQVGLVTMDGSYAPGAGEQVMHEMLSHLAVTTLHVGAAQGMRDPDLSSVGGQVARVGIGMERALVTASAALDLTLSMDGADEEEGT